MNFAYCLVSEKILAQIIIALTSKVADLGKGPGGLGTPLILGKKRGNDGREKPAGQVNQDRPLLP